MQLYAEPTELAEQVCVLLADAFSTSGDLLQLALCCLQTGHTDLATRLDRSDRLSADHRAELQTLETIDLLSIYPSWKATSAAGWQAALAPDALLRLGLLLSRSEGDAMARLRSDLQEVFGEAMAQADRPLALQLWDQLCRRCPDWSWARLRLQQQFVQEALRCWDTAIEQARAEGQFKWAIALVRRRHAAKMADLKSRASQTIPFNQELDRISSFLTSVADRYGIDLPPPSQSSDAPGSEPPPPNLR